MYLSSADWCQKNSLGSNSTSDSKKGDVSLRSRKEAADYNVCRLHKEWGAGRLYEGADKVKLVRTGTSLKEQFHILGWEQLWQEVLYYMHTGSRTAPKLQEGFSGLQKCVPRMQPRSRIKGEAHQSQGGHVIIVIGQYMREAWNIGTHGEAERRNHTSSNIRRMTMEEGVPQSSI